MTNERARTLLAKVLGVNPDANDAMRLFLAALQRGRGQPVYIEDGSPKGGSLIDPWRCALCVVLNLPPDVSEDAFRTAVVIEMDSDLSGSAPHFGSGESKDDLRKILLRIVGLAHEATDTDCMRAVAARLKENQAADSLELNSAEDSVRRQLGFSKHQWTKLGSKPRLQF